MIERGPIYPGLAAVPGMVWQAPVDVGRSVAREQRATPDERGLWPVLFDEEGRPTRDRDAWTSATPAQQMATPTKTMSTEEKLAAACAALAVPGTASDFHFILAAAAGSLFDSRLQQPDALEYVETFALANIALLRAQPGVLRPDDEFDGPTVYRAASFNTLVRLYETSGEIERALEYARLGHSEFQQSYLARSVARLVSQVETLQAEE